MCFGICEGIRIDRKKTTQQETRNRYKKTDNKKRAKHNKTITISAPTLPGQLGLVGYVSLCDAIVLLVLLAVAVATASSSGTRRHGQSVVLVGILGQVGQANGGLFVVVGAY